MQQIASLVYFLPCIISLLWLIIYWFRTRVRTQRLMMVMLVLCVYYFTTYAFLISSSTDYRVMSLLDVLNVPVILTILALDALFVSAHHSNTLIQSHWQIILFIPIFLFSSVNCLLYYIIGIDEASLLFDQFDRYGKLLPASDTTINHLFIHLRVAFHRFVVSPYILFILVLSLVVSRREGYRFGRVWGFFFRGQESSATRVICLLNTTTLLLLIPLAAIGRSYLYNHPGLGKVLTLLLSVSLFLLFYVEYVIDTPRFTLRDLSHVQFVLPQVPLVVDEPTAEVDDTSEDELPSERAAELAVAQHPELVDAVRKAFDTEQIYLDQRLSIQGMASLLSTNRTTLSLVIGKVYGTTFRQLVARYRIEAAKRYMLANVDAKQEVVAMECGFGTAQAFNQKFKEVEGESPRIWLMKQLEKADVTK